MLCLGYRLLQIAQGTDCTLVVRSLWYDSRLMNCRRKPLFQGVIMLQLMPQSEKCPLRCVHLKLVQLLNLHVYSRRSSISLVLFSILHNRWKTCNFSWLLLGFMGEEPLSSYGSILFVIYISPIFIITCINMQMPS